MKIVIMIYRLTGGGAERVASLWAKGFVERHHEVVVITSTKGKQQLTYKLPDNVKLLHIVLPVKNKFAIAVAYRLGITKAFYNWHLSKILHEIKPDVCIGVLGDYAYRAYKCTRDIGCKIINTEHNAYDRPDLRENCPSAVKMKFVTNKLFDAVTVLTKADTLVAGVPKENMFVLPNPLTFAPVNEIPAKEKIILAAGRLDVWHVKGFDLLLEAWGMTAHKYPEWRLQIAGTGTHKSEAYLKSLVEKYNIKKQVDFLGFCDDMQMLYRRASIFVLSSRHEGFGMVLTEAMSQGCACIACDFGGRQREIIENNTQGIVCPNNSVEAIRKALDHYLSNPEYMKSCSVNAVKRSQYYSLDKTMDRWERILAKVMDRSKNN